MTVREIASFLDGTIVGNPEISITGLAKIEEAQSGEITFIANPLYEHYLKTTDASAVIVSKTFDDTQYPTLTSVLIKVDDPYSSFVILLEKLYPTTEQLQIEIHNTAIIHPTATIGKNCAIGAYVVIGKNAIIGDSVKIFPHVVLGNKVRIGNNSIIYSHVTIREECILGNRVIIQPGAVIGADGFGFSPTPNGTYRKIPQRGIVVLEDDVEIQANTCIDRATLGETRIKGGTKLDNLIQIAHNVVVGKNTVIAGHTAVAGSTKIGNNVRIGGNVSITGHTVVADNITIAGHSGVTKSLTEEGETYFGYPVKKATRARRIEASLRQLPELLGTIREMQKKIEELEKKLQS